MNKQLIKNIIIIIIFIGGLIIWHKFVYIDQPDINNFIATIKYNCDNDKYITASYYQGPEVEANPGEMPRPTGTVEISLDGGTSQILNQTISGSGIRYANNDESFVFWSKGSDAIIMNNNSIDLSYTNCTVKQ